jgi:prepilin-type processing-associated H-X9-DG protein
VAAHFNPDEQWERVASELRAFREAQKLAWGDLDDAVIACYLLGRGTERDREAVERAMQSLPDVRECVEFIREVTRLEQAREVPIDLENLTAHAIGETDARKAIAASRKANLSDRGSSTFEGDVKSSDLGKRPHTDWTSVAGGLFAEGRFKTVTEFVTTVALFIVKAPARTLAAIARTLRRPDARVAKTAAEASQVTWLGHDPPPRPRFRFSIVDGLITLGIVGSLVALGLPAIQSARAAARRAQCINNLKQLGLATHNYLQSNNVFPQGIQWQRDPTSTYCWTSGSCLVALCQHFESGQVFNAANFSQNMYNAANTTVSRVGNAVLWCPSDPIVANLNTYPASAGAALDPVPLPMNYTSYGANSGMFFIRDSRDVEIDPDTCQAQVGATPGQRQMNGVVYYLSHVGLQAVIDGTSNTFLFAERAHGKLPAAEIDFWHWWTAGNYGDTMFTTFFGMNTFQKPPFNAALGAVCATRTGPDEFVAAPGSFHPGGAAFGFCDGSVKFIKDSISSWVISPATIGTPGRPSKVCMPHGFTAGALSGSGYPVEYTIAANAQIGILQQLSSRNGGEVIGSDQY